MRSRQQDTWSESPVVPGSYDDERGLRSFSSGHDGLGEHNMNNYEIEHMITKRLPTVDFDRTVVWTQPVNLRNHEMEDEKARDGIRFVDRSNKCHDGNSQEQVRRKGGNR